jgi:hypothetical protein
MIKHVNIEAHWHDYPERTFEAYVVVGDGQTVFDDDYPFDDRIFYYFHDQAELEDAKTGKHHEFTVTDIQESE